MNIYSNPPQAFGYTPQQMQGAFNQNMAQAHAEADPRFSMKPLDRAGMSRGAGQQQLAGVASAQRLAEGIAKAYGQQAEDQAANAGLASGNAAAVEGAGLDVSALAQQRRYADALAALQRQQAAMNMQQNALGGLLGGNLNSFLGF